MGIADRDYTRADYQPRDAQRAIGAVHMWSVTTWLLVINIAMYFLDDVLAPTRELINRQTGEVFIQYGPWQRAFAFFAVDAVKHLQVWRFITFQFLHAS